MDDNVIRLFEDNIDISQVKMSIMPNGGSILQGGIALGLMLSFLGFMITVMTYFSLEFIEDKREKIVSKTIKNILYIIIWIFLIILFFLSFIPLDKNYESQNWFSKTIPPVEPAKYHKQPVELLSGKEETTIDNTVYDLIEDRFKENFEEKKKELSQFDFDKACEREKSVHKNKEDINVLCGGNNFDSNLIIDGYIFTPEINIAQIDDYKDNAPEELSTDPKNTTVWADIIIDQPHADDR